MVTDDFRTILRRVGNVLIVIGVIDVGVMVACILTMTSYSSSLNFFAIVAGVLLRRGSLTTATWVTRIAAVFLGMAPVGLMLYFQQPFTALYNANRALLGASALVFIVVTSLAIWLIRELRRQPILDAMKVTGTLRRPPYIAAMIGFVFFAGMGLLVNHLFNSPTARKAVEVARAQYGTQYEYTVTQMSWAPHHASAVLTAYNDHESKTVTVSFDTP
jgi:hypothetical protein